MPDQQTILLKVEHLSKYYGTFRALHEISFEIKRGEVCGIIGENGAGKSTLLKMLSEIVAPSQGRITIYGKCAAILDIGTGFHPDLSGRDNVFLNGALMGLKKQAIEQQWHSIATFSGLQSDFLEKPVKTYSDGMYLRLAFATAFHLQADLLLIDEVLGVGDFGFRQQCLAHIKQLIAQKTTGILLVSHNLEELKTFCNTCIWLEKGQVKQKGIPADIILQYLQHWIAQKKLPEVIKHHLFCLSDVHVGIRNNPLRTDIYTNDPIEISFLFEKLTDDKEPLHVSISLQNENSMTILTDSPSIHQLQGIRGTVGTVFRITCHFQANFFNKGLFGVFFSVNKGLTFILSTEVVKYFYVNRNTDVAWADISAPLHPHLEWDIAPLNEL